MTTISYFGRGQVFGWDISWMIEQYGDAIIRRTDPGSVIHGFRKFDHNDLPLELYIARKNGDIATMIEIEAQLEGKI